MDRNQSQKEIVERYIEAYNNFDINVMLENLASDVQFENISDGEINLAIHGIEEFRVQAESAKTLFKERAQNIVSLQSMQNRVEVQIAYTGVLAKDLSNGLKKGDIINLNGKSTFIFTGGKISHIAD